MLLLMVADGGGDCVNWRCGGASASGASACCTGPAAGWGAATAATRRREHQLRCCTGAATLAAHWHSLLLLLPQECVLWAAGARRRALIARPGQRCTSRPGLQHWQPGQCGQQGQAGCTSAGPVHRPGPVVGSSGQGAAAADQCAAARTGLGLPVVLPRAGPPAGGAWQSRASAREAAAQAAWSRAAAALASGVACALGRCGCVAARDRALCLPVGPGQASSCSRLLGLLRLRPA